jgi:hypothetical protein
MTLGRSFHKRKGGGMTGQSIIQDIALIRQRVETIETAIMRTRDLLAKAAQEQRKAHEGIQKHAMGRDVFVPLFGGRQIKAHVMPTNAYPKQNPARRLTAGGKLRFCTSSWGRLELGNM